MTDYSKRDDWETPADLFADLDAEFDFILDAAAEKHTAKCSKYFTKKDDALIRSWGCGPVWINPPYSRKIKDDFIYKAVSESRNGTTCVMLLPVKTDTEAFHTCVWDSRKHKPRKGVEVRFLQERPAFLLDGKLPLDKDGKPMGGRQPHMVVILRGKAPAR